MNSSLDDFALLALLQSHDDNAINKGILALYQQHYKAIAMMVTTNNGTAADAQDLFQEVLVDLLPKVRRSDFVLTSKLSNYIFIMARNVWFKKLRQQHQLVSLTDSHNSLLADEVYIEDVFTKKHEIIAAIIQNMAGNCPKIIVMKHERGDSHATIAQFLHITEESAKVNLARCMKKLRELIANHPFFKQ
jgi:RNA polymerase sigma factor (sigma-70 family)